MSADPNQPIYDEQASVGDSGAGSAVMKWGRGHASKDKSGERLLSMGSYNAGQASSAKRTDEQEADRWAPMGLPTPLVSDTSSKKQRKGDKSVRSPGTRKNTERGETAKPHHSEGRHDDKTKPQIRRDILQLKPGDDLTLLFYPQQNDAQNSKPSPGQRRSDRQKEQEAAQRKPDEGRFPPPSRTDNIDGDTRSSGEKQRGGISGRHSGQHHSNEGAHAGKRRSHNERAAPENRQQPREGRAAGGRGPRQDTRHDGNSQRTPTSPTPEDGGVSLGYNGFSQQPPSCHRAGGGTGADSRQFNQRGQKPPDPHPSKSQQPPDQPLDTKNAELKTTIREMDEQISELKETISRLHQRDGDPTKADSYFATGFSDIACAIEQWVLQHCLGGPVDPDVGLRPTELQESLCMVSCEPEKHTGSNRVRVVSAVVAQLLSRRVFSSPFPGAPETAQMLQAVALKLESQGTFYQCQRWRALTMSVLAKGDDFDGGLAEYVDRLTEELGDLLNILSPPEPDDIRRKGALREIVERGAKLTAEIYKQPDLIFLQQVTPGLLYSAERMQDTSCVYSDSELEDGAATVHIQIFPAVLRRSCEEDGRQPAVVMKAKVMAVMMKAKVMAEPPSPGEVPWSEQ